MSISAWHTIFSCLWDWGRGEVGEEIPYQLPGSDTNEWIDLMTNDYDTVDRMMIDGETIGGG